MNILLLLFYECSEILFLFINAKQTSNYTKWYRNCAILRFTQFTLFWLFILLPSISFDFRVKGLFFIVFVELIFSVIRYLIKSKKTARAKKKAGLVLGCVGNALLFALAFIPSFLFTGYQGLPTTGAYEVATANAILIDDNRIESFEKDGSKREVPIYFFYPKTECDEHISEFPLVIFSHGAFGYYESNASAFFELASNGYVVISLDHPYHSFFTKDTNGKIITVNPNFINEIFYIDEPTTKEREIFDLSRNWLQLCVDDLNFVLDTVEKAKQDDFLSNFWFADNEEKNIVMNVLHMTNCDKIGLMGHSLGGATAVTVGRRRDDISAVIDLDGTMLGEQKDFIDNSYVFYNEPYPIPLFSIDNEEHHFTSERLGDFYVNHYIINHGVDTKNTYFVNSGHMNFTDLPLFSPVLARFLGIGSIDSKECIVQMNDLILSYYNQYLKNEGEITLLPCYE